MKCELCDSGDFTVLYKAGEAQKSQVVRCDECGLMYANPRWKSPDVEQIITWDPEYDLLKHNPLSLIRYDKEQLQVRDYRNSRRELAAAFPSRGKLLEIGSSFGFGLRAWRDDGWDVVGVEPWKYGAIHARQKLGLDVRDDILANIVFDAEEFDAIVMVHVIEHLDHPLAELKEIYRVLKPGGRFICETPRYDTLMFALLGRRERSLACSGHVYFFTTGTLAAMGEKAGFQVERVRVVGRSLTLQRLFQNVAIIAKRNRLEDFIKRGTRRLGLHRIRLYVNMHDMQRITFIKPATDP
jgi:SAM-dependent methyltransferase